MESRLGVTSLEAAIQSRDRLKALQSTELLDTPPERAFDRLTELVCRILKAPISMVTLIDADRQFYKSGQGLPEPLATERTMSLDVSFCKHVIQSGEPLVVPDTREDPVVCDNPAIKGFNILAYLGVPLKTPDGEVIGTLCALDNTTRTWSADDVAVISDLADLAMTEIAMRLQLRQQIQAKEQLKFQGDLLNLVEQAVIATDKDGHITFWNHFAETLYGWAAEETVGRNILEVTPATMSQEQASELMLKLQRGESWNGEFFVRRKDGTEFWAEVTDSHILDAHGQLNSIIGVSHDVSERKQFEIALKTSEEFNRSVLESSADCIKVLAMNGTLISINGSGMCAMEIDNFADFAGKYWPDLWTGDGFQAAQTAVIAARNGETSRFSAFWPTVKGRPKWWDVMVSPVRDAYGHVVRLVSVSRDITEARAAEEKLYQQNVLLQTMLESTSNLIYLKDLDGQLKIANSALLHALGKTAEQVIDKYKQEFLPIAAEAQQIRDTDIRIMRTGIAESIEESVHMANGFRTYLSTKTPYFDAEGKVVGLIGISTDITEQKRANHRLARLQQATEALSQRMEPERIAQLIVDDGVNVLGAMAGSVHLFSEDRTKIVLKAHKHYPEAIAAKDQEFDVAQAVNGREAAQTRQPIWFEISEELARKNALLYDLMHSLHSVSTVVAPLIVEDRVLGVLVLHFDRNQRFDSAEEDFLMALSSQCSQALERAKNVAAEIRARKDLEQFNAELEQRVAQRTAQLKSSHDQLRALAARLQDAREEERTRISREVHDVIGQYMTALKMSVSMLGRRLEKEQSQAASRIQDINQLLDEAIKSVRKVATELRPSILDDMGLVAALEWYVADFAARTNMICEFKCSESHIPMDADRATALYRLVQEALTNVARHAEATHIKVVLYEEEGVLHAQIKDNGRGITAEELSGRKSLGLVGMLERVQVFAGELKFEGRPGEGTTVSVTVPLNPQVETL